jgi:hypothetical protein
MAGKFLRGALVSFSETFPLPVPNVIVFQYNPETMTHQWQPAATGGALSTTQGATPPQEGGEDFRSNPLAVTGQPGESFAFTLSLDSNDMIADGNAVSSTLAEASGVYTRLAALEMLLFPVSQTGGGLIGSISAALGALGSGGGKPKTAIPNSVLPTVLFVWGPGRILPVRVTALTTTERLYDATLLNPTHAEVSIVLRVLTPQELQFIGGPLGTLASTAYSTATTLRETLAIANLGNSVGHILGMLPV